MESSSQTKSVKRPGSHILLIRAFWVIIFGAALFIGFMIQYLLSGMASLLATMGAAYTVLMLFLWIIGALTFNTIEIEHIKLKE
mgnify:CR=1 FL=1